MSQNTVRAVLVSLLSVTKYSQSCAGEFTECHKIQSELCGRVYRVSQNTVRVVLVSLQSVTKYSQSCAGEFTECHKIQSELCW